MTWLAWLATVAAVVVGDVIVVVPVAVDDRTGPEEEARTDEPSIPRGSVTPDLDRER